MQELADRKPQDVKSFTMEFVIVAFVVVEGQIGNLVVTFLPAAAVGVNGLGRTVAIGSFNVVALTLSLAQLVASFLAAVTGFSTRRYRVVQAPKHVGTLGFSQDFFQYSNIAR